MCRSSTPEHDVKMRSTATILGLAAILGLTGCSTPDPTGAAAEALAALEVKGRSAQTGYDRTLFGEPWADVDGNGCDTRNDILRRDLENIDTDGCVVYTGTLQDPYTGQSIQFYRDGANGAPDGNGDGIPGHSSALQAEHVVALSDSWQKGAQQWEQGKRAEFANDPLNLLIVDGPTNSAKGDSDAASWLPPNKAYRCEYVARQIAVKTKYGVWVTAAEQEAMRRILNDCPGQQLPTGEDNNWPLPEGGVATAPVESTPAPAPAPSGSTRYSSCAEAKAVGEGRYQQGIDPQYEWYQDGDGDGIACE